MLRLSHALQIIQQRFVRRVRAFTDQRFDIPRIELAEGFDVARQHVITFVVARFRPAIAPVVDPANHVVLIIGQIAHHPQGVFQHQIQCVVPVLWMNAAGEAVHGGLSEARGRFPQIRQTLVLGQLRVQPLLGAAGVLGQRGGRVLLLCLDSFGGDFGQPMLSHVRGQQVGPAGVALGLAQVDRLHEVITLER